MTEPTDPSWKVDVKPKAEKQLARLPRNERERIIKAILKLRTGLVGDVTPLSGRTEWRLRVGKWCVLFSVDFEKKMLTILTLGSRGDICKD